MFVHFVAVHYTSRATTLDIALPIESIRGQIGNSLLVTGPAGRTVLAVLEMEAVGSTYVDVVSPLYEVLVQGTFEEIMAQLNEARALSGRK